MKTETRIVCPICKGDCYVGHENDCYYIVCPLCEITQIKLYPTEISAIEDWEKLSQFPKNDGKRK